jgi:hypothetical protein
MGNCCGCLDWGPSLFKKEEEPPAPAPNFRPRAYASEAKTTFMTVSTEQLDLSNSDLTSLLRHDSSDDSSEDCQRSTDKPIIVSDDLKIRKGNNGTLRRRPAGCSLNSSEPTDFDATSMDANDSRDSRQLKAPSARTGSTSNSMTPDTMPGDLNPPSSAATDDIESNQRQPHSSYEAQNGNGGGGGGPASPRWDRAEAAPPASSAPRSDDGPGCDDTAAAVSSVQAADLGFSFRSGSYARSRAARSRGPSPRVRAHPAAAFAPRAVACEPAFPRVAASFRTSRTACVVRAVRTRNCVWCDRFENSPSRRHHTLEGTHTHTHIRTHALTHTYTRARARARSRTRAHAH